MGLGRERGKGVGFTYERGSIIISNKILRKKIKKYGGRNLDKR